MDQVTKVHVLHCGEVQVDRSLPFKERTIHPFPFTGFLRPKSYKTWLPVSCYIIEHPYGRILVDTGWHEEVRTKPRKHLGWLSYQMFRPRLREGESVLEQLKKYNLASKEIDIVMLTHLHIDHVSGVKLVRDAKQFLVSKPEWEAAQKSMGYVRTMWEGIPLTPFSLTEIPFGPYKLGLDLFGDGLVYLV